jgi:hypothetical protein
MKPKTAASLRLPGALAIIACMMAFTPGSGAQTIGLAGAWRLQLDRGNVGAAEHWFSRPLASAIDLPGTLPGHGIGDPVAVDTKWTGSIFDKSWYTAPEYAPFRQPGNIKVPFWLQPGAYFVGAAWYQRDVVVPADWAGRRVVLTLERPHWKTTVWLDDREVGSNDALSVPHAYDLGTAVAPGRHVLTVRVDNTLVPDIGENSSSITDHSQGNWNGVVGRIELTSTAPVWIDDLQVFPRVRDHVAVIRGRVAAAEGHELPRKVRLAGGLAGDRTRPPTDVAVAPDGSFTAEYPLGPAAPLWDEFNPRLHTIVATLRNGERREATFGLREIAASGRQFTLNGRKIFPRGTLDCAAFPLTGHPPTDVASWKREFRVAQAYGLNHIRFHSWCPPEAAFVAADELGVYLQVEVASWPNWSTTLGDGKPVDAWLDAETDRILRAYGNHPSFVFLCSSNEPGGKNFAPWLASWVSRHKASDPRRLITSATAWPALPENDYSVNYEPRIQQWGAGLDSRINARAPETRTDYRDFIMAHSAPVISHEIGQWCAYPNFGEMPKYTGYLKPRNFEIFRAGLEAHHMLWQAHDFLIASGKLQALCYKEEIESALRTPQMGGFDLLGLSDFPGQGTALVGVVDAFWDDKGYISAPEFRRFCNATVPLALLGKRVYTADERLTADIEVAHFGAAPLPHAVAAWKLVGDNGRIAASGRLEPCDIPLGTANALGRVEIALGAVPAPARYKLVVSLEDTAFSNDWDVWVYPRAPKAAAPPRAGVMVARELDAAAQASLENGGTVVLMIDPLWVKPDPRKGKIGLGFSSIFWNTAWTHGQAPHTLGLLCDPRNPAFATFPTDGYSNWQWWYVVTHSAAMILDGLPPGLHPTVQVIDDWFTNRKLGLVFEARVGRGRLLVTSIDLGGDDLDPVRRQLLASLLNYAASPRFSPSVDVTADQIRSLFAEPAPALAPGV